MKRVSQPERVMGKVAVSACTTYHTTFDEDLENYRAAQIQGIGLWEYKLVGASDEELAERLKASGLIATFCFPNTPGIIPGDRLFSSPTDPDDRLRLLIKSIHRFARFSPVAVGCLAGPPRAEDPAAMWRRVAGALREAAYAAGEDGVRLALEVVRPGTGGSLVSTITDAMTMIADINLSNVDVLVDTWHTAESPGIAAELAANVQHVAGIQLSDRSATCRGWYDRAMPGTGTLPILPLLRAARGAGFRGWYELEIFSDDGTLGEAYADSFWKQPPPDVLRQGRESCERIIGQALSEPV